MNPKVFVKPIEDDLTQSVRESFKEFGGVDSIVKGNVFIKMNNVAQFDSSMTNPEVVLSIVKIIKEASVKPKNIYIMDNCTEGYFSRLNFKIDNLDKNLKKLGAKPLYLDEKKSIDIDFNGKVHNKSVPIPRILYENLIANKDENTYINVPKLKTHVFTKVSICLKNQIGLLYDKEKIFDHYLINDKIMDIASVFRPDFNIVDASTVINYGPVALYKDWVVPMGLLVSGTDAVAVDTVCSKLIGIDKVKHLKMAAEKGFGCDNFEKIDVIPSRDIVDLYKIQLNAINPLKLPDSIKVIKGKEKACKAGCTYLDTIFQILIRNNEFKPVVGIYGKGHDLSELDRYNGPFIINGPCAVAELREYFENRKKKEKIKVFYINDHFNVAKMIADARKAMKMPFSVFRELIPCSLPKAALLFIRAKIQGAEFISVL
jgi:uncharacterized protein (DUF362 family)